MMGKGSTELGAKIASLEGAVSEQLPGVGTISKRLDKVEAGIFRKVCSSVGDEMMWWRRSFFNRERSLIYGRGA